MNGTESGRLPSPWERQLYEANKEAGLFYRQELLKATVTWPAEMLKEWRVDEALDPASGQQIGYAPDEGTRVIDHLEKKGFGRETLMRAGLMSWTDDGRVVDRYRDQLVVVSRDLRMEAVGFVGIGRDGEARSVTPQTPVHRSAEALTGVMEQIDALAAGATMMLVEHPLDAIAIDLVDRHSGKKQFVGIPFLGEAISDAQMQILRQYSLVDRVIVTALPGFEAAERGLRRSMDLSTIFDHVSLFERPSEPLLANPGRMEAIAEIGYLSLMKGVDGRNVPEVDDPDLGL